MESSEKRSERLKAMRMEAAQAENFDSQSTSASPGDFSNPLSEPFATPPVKENSPTVPRFDYYTDPMSAFSGSKRRINDHGHDKSAYSSSPFGSGSPMGQLPSSHSAGPRNHNPTPTPTPAHQFQINHTPDHLSYGTSFPSPGSGSWRNHIGTVSPFSGHRGTPNSVPSMWNRSGGTPGYGFTPNSSRGGYSSPGYGRGISPINNSGRGSGRWSNNSSSPGSGRSGGRGRGFHGYVSAQDRPDMFYSKSMVEDPWRFLAPVVGSLVVPANGMKTPDSLRSWLPKSVTMKKARVSEPIDEFRSQASLAECLALSFEEAINDASNV
eukprot:TRINITY_DN6175_c0_g1_i2.p1 TRINITY_DN6175_c0_g1~~TRINITY_DN6175_c0_g1_i2.p1  ORF type:complete len:324 (-),score=43.19 TRINITY_DN6175_c0_g1_i2:307-1278(-)